MNFQNIPRKDKLVKGAFLPKLDCFAFFDYEQIEYRLLAFYLEVEIGDPTMAQIFRDGRDPHGETAKLMLDIADDRELTDEERQIGKTGNFSIVYAGGVPTLMKQLDISGKKAAQLLRKMRERMPSVNELQLLVEETASSRGYVRTLWGRELTPDPTIPEKDALRKMLNALIQGCAADLARHAMRQVYSGLDELGLESHMVNMVHDELILDAKTDELPELQIHMPDLMDYPPVSEVVPIGVGMEIGAHSWADKETYV